MDSRQREKIEQAFAAVMAAGEVVASGPRANLDLTELCEGDEIVRREVQSLLRHYQAAGEAESSRARFLDPLELHSDRANRLGTDAMLHEWGGEAVGQRVDGFVIISKLGEGGMGIVYVAQQENPRRTIALKLIRRS